MQVLSPQQFTIYKFQQNNVIMLHKQTKILYQYFETSYLNYRQPQVFHNHLQQALLLPTGILYKKGLTSLHAEINNKLEMKHKILFEQQELVNTFLPVLQCLMYLHSKDIVHASVSTQNIIFNQDGDILLRDWLLQIQDNKYYEKNQIKQRTKNDDLKALGSILLEASSLVELRELLSQNLSFQNVLKMLLPKYSKGYVLSIYILVKNQEKYYKDLEKLLTNDQTLIQSCQGLNNILKKIKGQRQIKAIFTPPLLTHSQQKNFQLISKTPLTHRKISKIEDLQNKKTYNNTADELTKKKNIERMNKIVQKSNLQIKKKAPQLALKKMNNIKFGMHTNVGQQIQNKSIRKFSKQDILKFGSPMKRLRTIQKKKLT